MLMNQRRLLGITKRKWNVGNVGVPCRQLRALIPVIRLGFGAFHKRSTSSVYLVHAVVEAMRGHGLESPVTDAEGG